MTMEPPSVPLPDAEFVQTRKQEIEKYGLGSMGTRVSRAGSTAGQQFRLYEITPITKFSSLLQLMSEPVNSAIVYPKNYYKASNELTVLSLIICWTITLTFNPESATEHPARDYIPHFNPCFGWDFPPASYIAVLFAGLDCHLSWTYVNLEAALPNATHLCTSLKDRGTCACTCWGACGSS